jgi:hypothetical protein
MSVWFGVAVIWSPIYAINLILTISFINLK